MFYCAITKKLSTATEKPIRLVTKRRDREYSDDNGHIVGRGWEVEQEVNVTLEGLQQWCTRNPEDLVAQAQLVAAIKAEKARKAAELKAGATPQKEVEAA